MFLSKRKKNLTRSQIHRLVEEGYVLLNGSVAKPSRKLRPGDRVSLTVPPPRSVELLATPIPLNIHYQDPELLVVDKPAGMPVHPSPGHPSRTLVNALLALCPDLKGIGGEVRPGIVHRLDKDTSGLMVVAKTGRAHAGISQQFKGRAIRKGYLALVRGHIKPADGTIAGPIGRDPRNRKRMAVVAGGRDASTYYKALQFFATHAEDYSLVEVSPETGRTHQIRVHLAFAGHPLVGDSTYGKKSHIVERHFLHAHILGFDHPATGERMEFTSPLPSDLRQAIELLGSSGTAS